MNHVPEESVAERRTDLPSALDPDLLDRLARFGAVVGGRPLVGGRGGRTFAVDHDGGVVTVVHLRHGGAEALDREAVAGRRAHAAGVGPEVLDVVPEHGALVTRWVDGVVLSDADLRDAAVLGDVAVAVRALHDAPFGELTADYDAHAFRRRYLAAAADRGVVWPDDVAAEERRTSRLAAALEALAMLDPPVGAHADLVTSNLVRTSVGVVLLDHEYAGRADPSLDLGGLAATAELGDVEIALLVDAYLAGGPSVVTLDRVRAWRDVIRHAWYVWVTLGDDLGPEGERWTAWAGRARAAWSSASGASGEPAS